MQVLRAAFPDHALLGEEGGISGDTSSDYLWCIDPLDGTTNYTHKYPSFGVSVAVLEKAEAVAGVVVEFAGGPGTWVQRTYTGAAVTPCCIHCHKRSTSHSGCTLVKTHQMVRACSRALLCL